MQLHHRLVSILHRIRQDVATLLDKEAINAACREENYSWKNRLFNPANTVHLFILQILNHNTPLNDLPHKSGESFTGQPSAEHASGFLWESSNACFVAWPTRSCPTPAGSTSTTKAAGSAIGSSSWMVRVSPCLTPPKRQ